VKDRSLARIAPQEFAGDSERPKHRSLGSLGDLSGKMPKAANRSGVGIATTSRSERRVDTKAFDEIRVYAHRGEKIRHGRSFSSKHFIAAIDDDGLGQ